MLVTTTQHSAGSRWLMLLGFQSYHRPCFRLPPLVPIAADLAAIPGDGLSDDHLSNRASIPFRRCASHGTVGQAGPVFSPQARPARPGPPFRQGGAAKHALSTSAQAAVIANLDPLVVDEPACSAQQPDTFQNTAMGDVH
jgi:hypothetical protein